MTIAKAHGIAVTTAKTQLHAVFKKTGTHRQAELAAMLWRLLGGSERFESLYAPGRSLFLKSCATATGDSRN
jgi:hypothetical protein